MSTHITDAQVAELATANGWTIEKASFYDDEGVEGFTWTAPNGESFDVLGDWGDPPTSGDKIRQLLGIQSP